MTNHSYPQICQLLYRYAELMDNGDLQGVAELLQYAAIKNGPADDKPRNSKQMLALWQRMIKIHSDGTPRTRHLINNPIIDIDETAGTATARSYYTVLQCTDKLPLQVIASGRYHDTFVRVDGQWRFASRDYSLLDMRGDLSQHLNFHWLVQPALIKRFSHQRPSLLSRWWRR